MIGLVTGIIVGLLPGIPIFLGFMISVNFVPVGPENYLITAIVITIGSQFFGSVAALYYKIPGESSSFPVLIESKNITDPRVIYEAIKLTALGSLVATLIAGTLFYLALVLGFLNGIKIGVEIKFLLMAILFTIAVFTSGKILSNSAILLLGTVVSFYEDLAPHTILPQYFFNSMLALIIIFGFQLIWNQRLEFKKNNSLPIENEVNYKKWIPLMLVRSLIGSPFGFIPQLGSTISSYTFYLYEKLRGKGSMERIVSAETANNGAIIFSWLPLLLFGIPINGTEILLTTYYNMYDFNFSWIGIHSKQLLLYFIILFSGFVYYFMARAANIVIYKNMIELINNRVFALMIIAFSLYLFYSLNAYSFNVIMTHLIIFTPISYLISKMDVNLFALVISLLLSEELGFTLLQMYQIYLQ